MNTLQKIINECTVCGGTGVVSSTTAGGVRLDDCKCVKQVATEISIIRANIPKKYRDFDWRHLRKTFKEKNVRHLGIVRNYIEDLDNNIKKGKGMWFQAIPGTAKSSIICYILKLALEHGYGAYFARASHMISLKFDALKDYKAKDTLAHILANVQILALEEIEKIYLATTNDGFQNQLFYELISDIYDANIALLVSSNLHREDVLKRFPDFVQDRLKCLELITLYSDHMGRTAPKDYE